MTTPRHAIRAGSAKTKFAGPTTYIDAYDNSIRSYCFSYLSPTVQTSYLHSADGRTTAFTGPAASLVANGDVNIKPAQIIEGGSLVWRMQDPSKGYAKYSATGLLLREDLISGAQLAYTYSDVTTLPSIAPRPGLLLAVSDQFGRSINFTWNAAAQPATMKDPAGGNYQYAYDSNANLASVTYPDTRSKQYLYEPSLIAGGTPCTAPWGMSYAVQNALTGVVDENGARFATFTYDCYGNALSSEHAGGRDRTTFNYANTSAPVETDPLGTVRTHSFSQILSVNRPTGITLSSGGADPSPIRIKTRAYDGNGNVASVDDFTGNRSCMGYDTGRNLEISRVEGLGSTAVCSTYLATNATLPAGSRKVSTQWHPDWRLEAKRAEPGKLTTSVYNGQPDPFNANAIASCAPGTALLPDGKPIAVLCRQVEQATTDANGSQGFGAALQAGVANREQKWTYNQYGQVLTYDGPRTDVADVTTYAYYSDTSFTGIDPNAVGHTLGDL